MNVDRTYYTDYMRRFYVEGSEGAAITICNDGDGLGLVEVKTDSKRDKDYFGDIHLCLPPAQMRAFAKLLLTDAIEEEIKD